MGAWQHSSCLRFDTQVMLLCVYMPARCVHTAAGFFSVLRISGGSFMTEQKTSTESQSLPSSTPSHPPQKEESAWTAALKPVLLFIVLPAVVVLLVKWLTGV